MAWPQRSRPAAAHARCRPPPPARWVLAPPALATAAGTGAGWRTLCLPRAPGRAVPRMSWPRVGAGVGAGTHGTGGRRERCARQLAAAAGGGAGQKRLCPNGGAPRLSPQCFLVHHSLPTLHAYSCCSLQLAQARWHVVAAATARLHSGAAAGGHRRRRGERGQPAPQRVASQRHRRRP